MSGRNQATCGYERQWRTLGQHVTSGRIHHAYLFAGPRGVGKGRLAKTYAASLLCLDRSPAGDPCGTCDACRRIERNAHPDVSTFSLESQVERSGGEGATTRLSVETVRTIASEAAKRPYTSTMRVIIVDDVETMQGPAQEAFLKTLEEPPVFLVLILLADSADILKPTILSRTELVEFHTVDRSTIEVCLDERGIEDPLVQRVANVSLGRLGWALEAAGDSELLEQREEMMRSAGAWIAANPFERVARAFELTDRNQSDRQLVTMSVEAAGHLWRDILMTAAGTREQTSLRSFVTGRNVAAGLPGVQSVHRALASVVRCLDDLDANVRPRLALESMVMQWPTISHSNN